MLGWFAVGWVVDITSVENIHQNHHPMCTYLGAYLGACSIAPVCSLNKCA